MAGSYFDTHMRDWKRWLNAGNRDSDQQAFYAKQAKQLYTNQRVRALQAEVSKRHNDALKALKEKQRNARERT